MSIVAFKKKSVIKHGTNRSAKPPGGHWLPQGPFGAPSTINSVMLEDAIQHVGPVGFSLVGGRRSIPVGKDMKMSQQGTPFRGIYARGYGKYTPRSLLSEPLMNVGVGSVEVMGTQSQFIKPSTLSNRGMLQKRFKWAYNGQYPNNWVQPVYTGYQTDSASQGVYVHKKSVAHDTVVDVNNSLVYDNHRINHGPFGCRVTNGNRYTYNTATSNAPYTKNLRVPQTSSQHTLRVQRRCALDQKPYPGAVNNGTGILTGGINVSSVGSSCGTQNATVMQP
jgi:hypothetical protein